MNIASNNPTFVKPVHHMQVKAANKQGGDLRVSEDHTHYVYIDVDSGMTIYGRDASQLLKDWDARRMLKAEYPQLRCIHNSKTFEWEVSTANKKVKVQAACLEDAKDMALEILAKMEQKTVVVKRAAVKTKALHKQTEEDETDEDAESDEDSAMADMGDEATAEDAEEEEEKKSHSIVPAKYRARYKPFKDTNGDGLSEQIKAHVSAPNDAGKLRISFSKLRRFAEANGCWSNDYSHLNHGQMKMNVTNRLRAKIRKAKADGKEYDVQWK